ncbi:MAG: replicative DNA helicase [Clostridia bacterium]|nr:replicative DNA helicase [Clostridia bacterium]
MSETKAVEVKGIKRYPNNYEAEQSLLCCLLIDGVVAGQVIPDIKEDYFYNSRHKKIFNACRDLFNKNQSIDVITVNDQMTHTKTSDINIMEYLIELTSAVPSAANYGEYVSILHRDMVLRKLITAANGIIEDAYASTDERASLDAAEKAIFEITSTTHRGDLVHISEVSSKLLNKLDQMGKDKSQFKGLSTHFPRFDRLTNGLQKGNLIILAARPSVGKTSFALNIVSNIIAKGESDKVIAIFSLEMPAEQLVQRLHATNTNVSLGHIKDGNVDENEQNELWVAHTNASECKIYIDDTSLISPGAIFSKCRRLASQEKKIDLIIIDYLQLMEAGNEDGKRSRSENRQAEITGISRMMKILAMQMNCPVIVLSQMSRSIEQRDDKTPKLADLRESGAIEQDADIVLFLSREHEDDTKKGEYNVILDVAKHRNGGLDSIRLYWTGANVRFIEHQDQSAIIRLPVAKSSKPKYEN